MPCRFYRIIFSICSIWLPPPTTLPPAENTALTQSKGNLCCKAIVLTINHCCVCKTKTWFCLHALIVCFHASDVKMCVCVFVCACVCVCMCQMKSGAFKHSRDFVKIKKALLPDSRVNVSLLFYLCMFIHDINEVFSLAIQVFMLFSKSASRVLRFGASAFPTGFLFICDQVNLT